MPAAGDPAAAGLHLRVHSQGKASTESPRLARADLSLPPLTSPPSLDLRADGVLVADALAHFSTALQFEAAGKLRDALTHYLAVMEADPANATLALHTAELAYNFRGRAEAISLLEKALASRPDDPEAYLNLARFSVTYAPDDPFEKDRAAQVLAQALKKFPKRPDVYAIAAVTLLSSGRREEAIKVVDQAAGQEVGDPQFWLVIGRTAQQIWPMGQAEMHDESLRRVNPLFEKALHHAAAGQAGDAVRVEVAQFFLLTNQLEKARTLCEEMAAQTGNLQARKLLFRLHEAFNEKDKALATLEKLVKDAPKDVELRRLLAAAYQSREKFAQAVPHLEAAIKLGGGEVQDYLTLGDLLLRSQMYEKLVQLSQRSIRLFPDHAMFRVHAALAQRYLQKIDKAISAFAEAAELVESNQSELNLPRFYFQYGITLERGGRHEEAGRILEKSITLTPKDEYEEAAGTMNYLGYMWLDQGKYLDKAGELIRKANELMPDNAAYVDSLGWWHYKKGDYPSALKELLRAITLSKELQPDDAEIVEHVALVYLKLGDKAKARAYFTTARDLNPPDENVRKRIEDEIQSLNEQGTGGGAGGGIGTGAGAGSKPGADPDPLAPKAPNLPKPLSKPATPAVPEKAPPSTPSSPSSPR